MSPVHPERVGPVLIAENEPPAVPPVAYGEAWMHAWDWP